MASDRKTFEGQDADLSNAIGGWLDPFAGDMSAAVDGVEADTDESLPFSEWCVIPVALAFVFGDMILQFLK